MNLALKHSHEIENNDQPHPSSPGVLHAAGGCCGFIHHKGLRVEQHAIAAPRRVNAHMAVGGVLPGIDTSATI